AGAAIAGAAGGTVTSLSLLKIMAMKLKFSVIAGLVLAGVATPLMLEHQAKVKLRDETRALRQQREQAVENVAALAAENMRLSNLVAQANGLEGNRSETSNEVLKLRGEVTRLRAEARASAQNRSAASGGDNGGGLEPSFRTWAVRAKLL